MRKLPLLPGYSFTNPSKTRFHVSQTLGYQNGCATKKFPKCKIGGTELLDYNALSQDDMNILASYDPTLTYGQAKPCVVEPFIPDFVKLSRKILRFQAWFKETVRESPDETYRVRYLTLYYYIVDDTISAFEHYVPNSGLPQGEFIHRQKIAKNDFGDCWSWKDLNVAINIALFGKVIHIYDCDPFTREWLESQGTEVNCPEMPPLDPYTEKRRRIDYRPELILDKEKEVKRLKQFLMQDGKVLRFFCIWDNKDQFWKELRTLVLQYYLSDDTMDIKEIHHRNDGRDLFPFLVSRHRIPKNRTDIDPDFNSGVLELTDQEIREYFSPCDFGVGKTIMVYNRPLLLYDCDKFTKAYYWKNYGITDFTPVDISREQPEISKKPVPPWNFHGTLDDSMQNVRGVSRPPRKDYSKMINCHGSALSYLVVLDNPHPLDACRRFTLKYYLADDTICIFEMPSKEGGFVSGKFLMRCRVRKPSSSIDEPVYYGPQDFAIGAVIEIYSRKFKILDADKGVLKFLEEIKDEVPEETLESLRRKNSPGVCGGCGDQGRKMEEAVMGGSCPPLQTTLKSDCN